MVSCSGCFHRTFTEAVNSAVGETVYQGETCGNLTANLEVCTVARVHLCLDVPRFAYCDVAVLSLLSPLCPQTVPSSLETGI